MWLRSGKTFQHLEALGKFSVSPWRLKSCSFSDTPHKKTKIAPLQERRMRDQFRLWVKGGDGGNGCSSSQRSRHDRHGRSYGGDGGRGGDVILECSPTVWDYSGLQHHINAKKGGHGASKNMIGTRGSDKVVRVPVGTVIHLLEGGIPSVVETTPTTEDLDPWEIPGKLDFDNSDSAPQSVPIHESATSTSCPKTSQVRSVRTDQASSPLRSLPQCNKSIVNRQESQENNSLNGENWSDEGMSEEETDKNEQIQYTVAELTEPGQRIVVARGGEGGSGNVSLGKAFRNPSPRLKKPEITLSEQDLSPIIGLPGSEAVLMLELKSIADVGLVGMPNAGKSTILGSISRAKPVVGHYAFTTLRPNLGNLNYDDFSVTVADIPGLIRGAHDNQGLGHAFLRHVERTKVIAYVLDLGCSKIPPWEQLRDLVVELEMYREGLSSRACLVVANKIDEEGAEEMLEELKKRVRGVKIFPVCAVLEEGMDELKEGLRLLVDKGEEESCGLNLDNIVLD